MKEILEITIKLYLTNINYKTTHNAKNIQVY
jgi:hypothetical protein